MLSSINSEASKFSDYFYKLDSYLYTGKYITENELFIIGSNGYVIYSPDNGSTWERKLTYNEEFYISLNYVKTTNTLFISGTNGILLKSTDKGDSWQKVNLNTINHLLTVTFKDNYGVITGNGGDVFISKDYGETWEKESNFTNKDIKCCTFVKDEIYLVDNLNVIYHKKISETNWIGENRNGEIIKNEIPKKLIYHEGILFLLNSHNLLYKYDNTEKWNVKFLDTIQPRTMHFFTKDTLSLISPNQAKDNYTFFTGMNFGIDNLADSLVPYIPNFPKEYLLYYSYIENIFSNEKGDIHFAVGMNGTIYKYQLEMNQFILVSHLRDIINPSSNKQIFFVNDSVGFIGLGNSVVLRTRNKGTTFLTQKFETTNQYCRQIFFKDELNGFRLLDNFSFLTKTVNGGESYNDFDINPKIYCTNFTFSEDAIVFTGNSPYKGINYGQISVVDNYKNTPKINKFSKDTTYLSNPIFLSENEILVSGSKVEGRILDSNNSTKVRGKEIGIIYRSNDKGITWTEESYNNFRAIHRIYFVNSDLGFASASYFDKDSSVIKCLLRTEDSGKNWIRVLDNSLPYFEDVVINMQKGNGLLLKSDGSILQTSDFGKTWREMIDTLDLETGEGNFTMSYVGNEVYLTSSRHMYRAYPGKFPPNPVSVKSEVEGGAPPFWIYPPFPNPTKSDINFRILWSKQISLEKISFALYDVLGTKIVDFQDISANYELENLARISLEISKGIKGLYYLRANYEGFYKTYPVVIE
jgi:photosystem II stability/assembly factor-like uncharacterized protein